MRKTIVITDLTQMPRGNEVCVVGIDPEGRCIRPVCEGGFLKQHLRDTKQTVIVRHGAKVEFDFHRVDVVPPHIEDQGFDLDSIVNRGFCNDAEWQSILRNSSYTKVGDIFDSLLQDRGWVMPGAKTISIATLSRARIVDVELTPRSIKPRITFVDRSSCEFTRPSSDLTLWDRCRSLVRRQGRSLVEVEKELLSLLQSADRPYLRLGLARPWVQPGLIEKRCYLQVTGIYTFPDYLEGKSFADFLPH